MSTNGQGQRSERRARRSTRVGIFTLILLAVIVVAVVWGISRWAAGDDATGPSVYGPESPAIVVDYELGRLAA
ncbi:hypothetical protein BH23CHL1_BH23CHL1_21400 [soil metagenome]